MEKGKRLKWHSPTLRKEEGHEVKMSTPYPMEGKMARSLNGTSLTLDKDKHTIKMVFSNPKKGSGT